MKKVFAHIFVNIIVCCFLFAFTACSGQEDGSVDTQTDNTAAPESPVQASPTEVKSIAPVRLEVVHALSSQKADLLDALTAGFNASNPYGITVTLKQEDADTLLGISGVQSEAEEVDLAQIPDSDLVILPGSLLQKMSGGMILLDELLAADFSDRADIPEAFFDDCRTGAHICALPFDRQAEVLYCNATMFEEAGLSLPATWEDVLKAGETLRARAGVTALGCGAVSDFLDTLLHQNDAALLADGKAGFNRSSGKDALTVFLSLFRTGAAQSFPDTDARIAAFHEKRVACVIASTDAAAKIHANDFQAVALKLPATGKKTAAYTSGNNLVMLTKDQNAQLAAWEYMKYLTETERTANWAIGTGSLPVRKSAFELPSFRTYASYDLVSDAAASAYDDFYGLSVSSDAVSETTENMLNLFLRNGTDASDACDLLLEEIGKAVQP